MEPSDRKRRLGILVAAVAVAGFVWGVPRLSGWLSGAPEFTPLAEPAGFRLLLAGASSRGFDAFVGLDQTSPAVTPDEMEAVRSNICASLFGAPVEPGVVPIAMFSDYNCPYCGELAERLDRLASRSEAGVRLTWHELPILGDTSKAAARGALAADLQGAYAAFRKRLVRAPFLLTPELLEKMAEGIGLDGAKLRSDMHSDLVSNRLRNSAALADFFGLYATPSLVIGRSVVIGTLPDRTILRLVAMERAEGPLRTCETGGHP